MKLTFKEINIELLNQWKNSITSNDFSISTYNGIPENLIASYCKVLTQIENDMPDEPGNEEVSIDKNEIRNEKNVISYILFNKNEIIGISRFFVNSSYDTNIYQAQFGILDPYRHKGLAKFLLSFSYNTLLNSHAQLEYITVDTHPSNNVIIDLFSKIGFRYTHTETIYRD